MSLNLITDRTQADVDRYYYFRDKRWSDLTDEEKEEFARGLKGSYNYTDFKRVENAVAYLSSVLNSYGYRNIVKLSSEETFTPEYIRTKEEIITYLDNIATLQKVYYNSNWVGKLPTIEEWLDYNGANTIEQILVNIETLIEGMKQVFVYSGVAGAGQNRIWQQRFRRPIEALNYKVFGNVEQATREGYNMIQYYNTFRLAGINIAPGLTDSINEDGSLQVIATAGNGNWHTAFWNSSQTFTDTVENKLTEGETFTIVFTIKKTSGSTGMPKIYMKSGMGYYAMNGTVTEEYSEIYYTGTWKKANNISIHIGWSNCVGTFTIKNWMIKKGTYKPIEPYGVMPSLNYPSTVYGLGSRTINKFDNSLIINNGITTKIKNGFRMVKTSGNRKGDTYIVNLQAGSYKFEGNVSTDVVLSDDVSFIIKYEDGTESYVAYKTMFLDGGRGFDKNIVSIQPYFQSSVLDGKYFEVEDFMIVNQKYRTTNYIPHNAIELKQKIGYSLVDTVAKPVTGLTVIRNLDGTITINGTLDKFTGVGIINRTGIYFRKGVYSIIVENDKGKTTAGDFYYYYKNDPARRYLYKSNNVKKSQNFTEDVLFDAFYLYLSAGTYDNVTYKFQIVKGSEYKPYTPFIEVNKYIDLTNHEPLMKIGDVEDVVDYENSRIVRHIGKLVLDGSSDELWVATQYTTNDGGKIYYLQNDLFKKIPIDSVNYKHSYCSHFTNVYMVWGNLNNKIGQYSDHGTTKRKYFNTPFATVEELRSGLSENPITLYFILETPYYEEIDLPSIQKIPGEYSLTAYDEYLDGRVEKE